MQHDVVERTGRRAEDVDELLDDVVGAAAQAEGVGGVGGEEVDGAAADLEVGGVVEVRPDLAARA